MKTFILFASAASLVRAGGLLTADAAAGLGLSNDGAVDANAKLALGVNLPKGVQPDNLHLPVGLPDADHIKTWHPPHPGVLIDGCDDNGNDEWHYVHPCKDCSTSSAPPHVWTTSTVPAYATPTVVKCTDCVAGQQVVTVTVPPTTTIVPVPATASDPADPAESMPTSAPTSVDDPAVTTSTSTVTLALESVIPTTSVDDPADDPTTTAAVATSAPSQGFMTYTVPAAQPSSGAPIYKIPSNQTAPVYTPPAPPAAGCVGEGCRPVNSTPVVVANPGQHSGTGAVVAPTSPVVVAGASRQSVGALLLAGAAVALLL